MGEKIHGFGWSSVFISLNLMGEPFLCKRLPTLLNVVSILSFSVCSCLELKWKLFCRSEFQKKNYIQNIEFLLGIIDGKNKHTVLFFQRDLEIGLRYK